jgi:tRNA(adenine34) deaminase
MPEIFSDEYFMRKAIDQALTGLDKGEVPVGAIIVSNNKIIAKGHNLTETLNDVTAHAEMQAITSASGFLGGKYLNSCTLFVTLEPCVMCAGALFWSQIGRVVVGASDPKRGFRQAGIKLHPKSEVVFGLMENECSAILTDFFKTKR